MPEVPAPVGGARADARLFGSEMLLVLRRRRNQVLLGLLALVPVLVGVAVDVTAPPRGSGAEGGPAFLASITENGLFLAFTSLVLCLPVFLPLVISVVAGEAIAGEAGAGTLRYLLVVPVARTRLLVVKYASMASFGLLAAAVVALAGVVVGLALFPVGPVTLLSGTSVSYGQGLLRLSGVVLYVTAALGTVAALGLFVSTLTEVPIAAMASTAIAVVLVEVLDAVPQLDVIHPWLFTDSWLAFGDLLRDPVAYGAMGHGLVVQLCWDAVLLSLAWARMTSRDVTS